MGEIVNLNRARKTREATERKAAAAANRVVHGRSKAELQIDKAGRARDAARLDGHKRED
jgi:hypothetical protein